MLYVWVGIELFFTLLFLGWRYSRFQKFKQRMNPNGHPETHHNLVKTGKTKRIKRERTRYINQMVMILAIGLSAISLTMFINASEIVNQHREDGLITMDAASVNDELLHTSTTVHFHDC